MPTNPLVQQGTLNRLRASVIVPSFTALNISSPYMGKNFVHVTIDGPFVTAIDTATGIVTSPEPFAPVTVTVDILRTQALAMAWRAQSELTSVLGTINVHADTSAYEVYEFSTCYIERLDPNAYDGRDPVARLVIKGIYSAINSDFWSLI